MRDLLSISHQNTLWEVTQRAKQERMNREQAIAESRRQHIARMRTLWGPGPTDDELIDWWRTEHPTTAVMALSEV